VSCKKPTFLLLCNIPQKTVVTGDRRSYVRADPYMREKRENGMRKYAKNGSLKTFLLVVCFNLLGEKLAAGAQNGPWQNALEKAARVTSQKEGATR
jgi:hypothetical protein